MNRVAGGILIGVLIGGSLSDAHGYEQYLLQDNEVLLYKIVNWWYDADDEESRNLCGMNIRYIQREEPVNETGTIQGTVRLLKGFGSLLSFQSAEGGTDGWLETRAHWHAADWFGDTAPLLRCRELRYENECELVYPFRNTFLKAQAAGQSLEYDLQGRVMGLNDGRVSLVLGNDQLGKCSMNVAEVRDEPVAEVLVKDGAGQIVARFSLWQ